MSTAELKVKERPILFSGPMVRAILEGRKTQTRRVIKPKHEFFVDDGPDGTNRVYHPCYVTGEPEPEEIRCPYGSIGERLWVRESHAIYRDAFARKKGDEVILYRADASAYWNMTPRSHMEAEFNPLRDTADYEPKWKPSIHMPRWASRITLEITGVRVERLNDISEADAYAEGVTIPSHYRFASNGRPEDRNEARVTFETLWESINGPGSWAQNPWVWVVEFKQISNL